jgi:hypothetical protein
MCPVICRLDALQGERAIGRMCVERTADEGGDVEETDVAPEKALYRHLIRRAEDGGVCVAYFARLPGEQERREARRVRGREVEAANDGQIDTAEGVGPALRV